MQATVLEALHKKRAKTKFLMRGFFMKKLIFIAVICLASFAANADTWTSAFTIGAIRNVNDNRIIFYDASNSNQYQFDGSTTIGKNMLTMLLSCKAMGRPVKVLWTSLVSGNNWWAISSLEIQN
jgi:hypothetical protein